MRHELGLDRPVLSSSNSHFKGLPINLRSIGLKFSIIFASCCCSLFLHFVTNPICIFLVPCHLVLISTLPQYCYIQVLFNCYIQVLYNCYIQVLFNCYTQVLFNCYIQVLYIIYSYTYYLYVMLYKLR